jgi:hypothetical protein
MEYVRAVAQAAARPGACFCRVLRFIGATTRARGTPGQTPKGLSLGVLRGFGVDIGLVISPRGRREVLPVVGEAGATGMSVSARSEDKIPTRADIAVCN